VALKIKFMNNLIELELDFSGISTIREIHLYLKEIFGFPDFYGKNIHALIDCLSSLRSPEDGMVSINIEKNQFLLLRIRNVPDLEIFHMVLLAIEEVNKRHLYVLGNSCILISFE
jgi:RNAse (barnase) inhibitor barstar